MRFLIGFVVFFSFSFYVFAEETRPSFDCKKAVTLVEKEICSNKELADLDKKVAVAFSDLKKNPNGRIAVSVKDLIKDQREWLENRGNDECLGDCLKDKYKKRLFQFSFPGAPSPLNDEKVKELEKFFVDKDCENLKSLFIGGLTVGPILITNGLDEFVCKIYEKNPTIGKQLFFTSCDEPDFYPICRDTSEIVKQVAGLKEYIDHLNFLYGKYDPNSCGTMQRLHVREQNAAGLLAMYDMNPIKEGNPAAVLFHFSQQGVWQKEQYQKYLNLKEKAQKGLEKYYIEMKKIPVGKVKQIAEINLLNLANVYIGKHYARRDTWNLKDVDNFLKSGAMPANEGCGYVLADCEKDGVKSDIVEYLLKLAVVNNYSKQDIEKIISAGTNIHKSKITGSFTTRGDNALMSSVKRLDIMKLLIEKGANVNAQNKFGKTALMYAIQYGNLDAVKMLVEHKADVNLATFENVDGYETCEYDLAAKKRTPLMYAAWHANDEVVKYLLSKGAKQEAKDTEGHDYTFYLTKNDYLRKD